LFDFKKFGILLLKFEAFEFREKKTWGGFGVGTVVQFFMVCASSIFIFFVGDVKV